MDAQADALQALNTSIRIGTYLGKDGEMPISKDEQVLGAMSPRIDPGLFSCWKGGSKNPPLNRLGELCFATGVGLLIQRIAADIGCGLYMRKSQAEILLESVLKERDEAREKLAYLESLHTGTARR